MMPPQQQMMPPQQQMMPPQQQMMPPQQQVSRPLMASSPVLSEGGETGGDTVDPGAGENTRLSMRRQRDVAAAAGIKCSQF